MNTGLIVLFVVLGICLLIGLPVAFPSESVVWHC